MKLSNYFPILAIFALSLIFVSCENDEEQLPITTMSIATESITIELIKNESITWNTVLGEASFASDSVWVIPVSNNTPKQEWSDAVQIVNCGCSEKFSGDCRPNPGQKGDLFSWYAVDKVENLCPEGWRVPTREDFINLDKAMGGNGNVNNRYENPEFVAENYINRWGGTFGGYTTMDGQHLSQGSYGNYWSQTESATDNSWVYTLLFTSIGDAYPQGLSDKRIGLSLRCVRDGVNSKEWNTSLGKASFVSDSVWVIPASNNTPKQEWSDAVQTDYCSKKETYSGYNLTEGYCIDCRSNPGQKGNLFSWRAVAETENICPEGWRVPTVEDFINLDKAMGGSGNNRLETEIPDFITKNYINHWGAALAGNCDEKGVLSLQGLRALYWSLSGNDAGLGNYLGIETDGGNFIYPQVEKMKGIGFSLRCIR